MIIFALWISELLIVVFTSVVLDELLELEEDFPIALMAVITLFNIIFIWRYH